MPRTLGPALCLVLVSSVAAQTVELFDGKTLNGWSGDPAVWSVRDGRIVGITRRILDRLDGEGLRPVGLDELLAGGPAVQKEPLLQ